MGLGTLEASHATSHVGQADEILFELRRHRVGGFLFQKTPSQALAAFPEAFRQSLRQTALDNLKRSLTRVGELQRIQRQLDSNHIRFLAFKGPVTELEYYGQHGIRHVGDLDLLIDPVDLPKADECLAELGYTRSFPPGPLSPVQWRHFIRSHHELNHRDLARHRLVELQWQLGGFPSLPFEVIWNARRCVPIAGSNIPAVSSELSDLHVFVHGAGHRWQLLFWLVDAALLLQQRSEDQLDRMLALARLHRVELALLQGACVARELLGVRIPPSWNAAAQSLHTVRWLSEASIRQIRNSNRSRGGVAILFRDLVYLWRLQPGARARLALIRPRLLSVENWTLLPLPDALFWLYYPLAPLLWLVRQLGRRFKNRRSVISGADGLPAGPS